MPSTYDILFKSGARLYSVSAETAFQAVTVPEVRFITDHEYGHIVWPYINGNGVQSMEQNNEPELPKKAKVGGITRADSVVTPMEQYDEPLIVPMAYEWGILTFGKNIKPRISNFRNGSLASSFFKSDTEKTWMDGFYYDEVRLYHNGKPVRISSFGFEEFRDYEWEYKNAYINTLVHPSKYYTSAFDEMERSCIENGLTDVVLFRAKQQCDRLYKLYNRGLVSECNANALDLIFMN